jgi:LPPG:FO 2-phospho-L-lactate transferase
MSVLSDSTPNVVALAGGVGGARLVDGLDRALPPGALTVVVNTGDDFEHWGLHISPDLDTIMYTLAGLAPEERGWGIEGDSFHALQEARRRGAADWFQLGDRDLITHLSRTKSLANGASLTQATAALCKRLGVERRLLPMSDTTRATIILTVEGRELPFQEWLVKARAAPKVRAVRYDGTTEPTGAVLDALAAADLAIICPSNPYVSIDPILGLDGVSDALRAVKTVAVSPIIGGKAVKGPLCAMIKTIEGCEPSAKAVAEHYEDLLDAYAVQTGDHFTAAFPVFETNILIQSKQDRLVFARELLELSRSLR